MSMKYFPVQDWYTTNVPNTDERVQTEPVSIQGADVCDLLVSLPEINANTVLLIEGSDSLGQNFNILAVLDNTMAGDNFIRLNDIPGPLPALIRWKARCTVGAEALCFAIQGCTTGGTPGTRILGAMSPFALPSPVAFQDWITVTLNASADVVYQLPAFYLDTSTVKCITIVPEISHKTAPDVTLTLETAHSLAGPWFASAALAGRTPIQYGREPGAANILGNYLRWKATAGGANAQITFRLDTSVVELSRTSSGKGALLFSELPRQGIGMTPPARKGMVVPRRTGR